MTTALNRGAFNVIVILVSLSLSQFWVWDGTTVCAQVTPVDYRNLRSSVEKSVVEIADAAKRNHQGRLESLDRCKDSITCHSYRLACHPIPLAGDGSNSRCLDLPKDNDIFTRHCTSTNQSCTKARFFKGSYIRVPGWNQDDYTSLNLEQTLTKTLDEMSCDQLLSLCSLMQLDSIFESVYTGSNYNGSLEIIGRSMFGASNGMFRIYPGMEMREDRCKESFDCRKRAWYKVFTSVKKRVTLLLDTGMSTADRVRGKFDSSETVLEAAKDILKEYLDTLNKFDEVSLYKFDGSGASPISKPIVVTTDNGTELAINVKPWKDEIEKIKFDLKEDSNLTKALETVIQERFNASAVQDDALNILLIIAGERVSLSLPPGSPTLKALARNEVRTFIAQWEPLEANDTSFVDLSRIACRMNGSYTKIDRNSILSDELSALQSFFSYLANIRFKVAMEKPIWVSSYDSASDFGKLLAVAYPAFDDNRELIGVASISIMADANDPTIDDSGNDRTKDGRQFARNPDCQPGLSSGPQTGHCSPDPAKLKCDRRDILALVPAELYAERTCCDKECSFQNPGTKGGDGFNAVPVVVSVVVFLVIVSLVALFLRWWLQNHGNRPVN